MLLLLEERGGLLQGGPRISGAPQLLPLSFFFALFVCLTDPLLDRFVVSVKHVTDWKSY